MTNTRHDLDLIRDLLLQVGDADGTVGYEDLGGDRTADSTYDSTTSNQLFYKPQ